MLILPTLEYEPSVYVKWALQNSMIAAVSSSGAFVAVASPEEEVVIVAIFTDAADIGFVYAGTEVRLLPMVCQWLYSQLHLLQLAAAVVDDVAVFAVAHSEEFVSAATKIAVVVAFSVHESAHSCTSCVSLVLALLFN